MQGTVRLEIEERPEGKVARMTIDRPRKRNALTSAMVTSITEHALALARDEDLRVLVLTGEGDRAFVAGADLGELSSLDRESARTFITGLHRANAALRHLPVPVVARVNGHCLGAGMEMAASCDLRIACRSAVFGMPEVRVGLPSVIEAALLPRLVGWGRASDLMLTGDQLDAQGAFGCGFVQRLCEDHELDLAVERCVASILKGGPRAVRLQKALFLRWEGVPPDAGIESGIDFMVEAYRSDEPTRLQSRFLRRSPV